MVLARTVLGDPDEGVARTPRPSSTGEDQDLNKRVSECRVGAVESGDPTPHSPLHALRPDPLPLTISKTPSTAQWVTWGAGALKGAGQHPPNPHLQKLQ